MSLAADRRHVSVDGAAELLDAAVALTGHPARIGALLIERGRGLDLAEARWASERDGRSVVLATRDDGSLLAARWFPPGVATPVHGHGAWGVAAVLTGRDHYERWTSRLVESFDLGEGEWADWGDPPFDVHRQTGLDDGAFELVVLGGVPQ